MKKAMQKPPSEMTEHERFKESVQIIRELFLKTGKKKAVRETKKREQK